MISIHALMALAALLQLKHLVADGPLQTVRQVRFKGFFLHPAGLGHSATHVVGTAIVLVVWSAAALGERAWAHLDFFVALLAVEFVLHYAIDYFKSNVDMRLKLSARGVGPDGEPQTVIRSSLFFHAFLVDQMMHALTYVAGLYAIARVLGVDGVEGAFAT